MSINELNILMNSYQNHDYCPLKLWCRLKLLAKLAQRHTGQSSWLGRSTISHSDYQTSHPTSLCQCRSMNRRQWRGKRSHKSIATASRWGELFYVFAIDKREDSPSPLSLNHSLSQPIVESTFSYRFENWFQSRKRGGKKKNVWKNIRKRKTFYASTVKSYKSKTVLKKTLC